MLAQRRKGLEVGDCVVDEADVRLAYQHLKGQQMLSVQGRQRIGFNV